MSASWRTHSPASCSRKAVPKAELGLVSMTDLAEFAVFLASPAASKMTGQALSVTGGISAL